MLLAYRLYIVRSLPLRSFSNPERSVFISLLKSRIKSKKREKTLSMRTSFNKVYYCNMLHFIFKCNHFGITLFGPSIRCISSFVFCILLEIIMYKCASKIVTINHIMFLLIRKYTNSLWGIYFWYDWQIHRCILCQNYLMFPFVLYPHTPHLMQFICGRGRVALSPYQMICLLSVARIQTNNEKLDLPCMYRIPMMHNNQYRHRFIANSWKCSTMRLFIFLTKCLHTLSKVFRSTSRQPTREVGSIRCWSSRIQKNY